MDTIQKLEGRDVPVLKKVYIHEGALIGIDLETGELVIVAKVVGEGGQAPEREVKRRGPRKKKENSEAITNNA